jgi:2-polyprenyl-3-methyl-5-hydroxy-6-metoxy-1,4-benzoquinol methylase
MSNVEQRIFEQYARHYEMGSQGIDRLPGDMEKLLRDRVPLYMKDVPPDARILDVGCAQGHLLAILQRAGYTHLAGVDLSPPLIEQARKLVTSDVALHVADAQSFLQQQPEGSYDVIFFHDVLEHIPREFTVEVLSEFHRALAPGGFLSLRVPNMASLLASYNAHIDFTHVTQFTEFALLQVLEQAGFNVNGTCLESQAPILYWSWRKPHRAFLRLLNHLRWRLNNVFHRVIYKLSDVFPIPTVFDFNIIMTARKQP